MSKDKLNRYERAFRYVRDIAQQHCESYTQFCLRTDVLVEAIKKAEKYDELQSILEEYNVTPENIREVLLTGQMFRNQPTLSECIKEWEERGFKYIRCSNALEFENKKEDITICILKGDENINITDNSYCYSRAISFDLHNLIHKTLKALEEMKDD